MSALVTAISGLQNLPNLQNFNADFNGFIQIDFSGMSNLQYIDISDCDLPNGNNSLTQVNLTGCSSLLELRIDDSNFSGGFPNLAGLNSLEYIDADQCSISGSLDLSGLPALTGFDLSGNTELTEVVISSTQPLGSGNSLYLYNCALTQTAVDNILVALSLNGIQNGYVELNNGTSAAPGSTGLAAKQVLEDNGWTVYVNEAPPARVDIAASTDFNITGDFTIEMFVNMSNLNGFPRPYSFGAYPAPNAMSIEGGSLYFWANGSALINGTFQPNIGDWYHICVMGSGSTAYMFINGFMVANSPYGGSISSQGLPLTIGYGNENNSGFNGLISNFRWTNSAVYNTQGFTVPTSPLTDLTDTILLIFQGNDLAAQLVDNSGNGHNASNSGAAFNTNDPFNIAAGSLQMGNV